VETRHNENNKGDFRRERFLAGATMVSRCNLKIFAGKGRLDILIFLLALLTSPGKSLAQTTESIGLGTTAQAASGKDEVPRGGCMPIGVTVSGEMVFPFSCKAFLEQRRGPIEERKPAFQADSPASAQKAETPAAPTPLQTAVPVKDDPDAQPVDTDSSPTSSIEDRKRTDIEDKAIRRAKRARHSRSIVMRQRRHRPSFGE
jgi:hypothetical protein